MIAKTVKLQVFLEPKQYLELVNDFKALKIPVRNDSDLITKVIVAYVKQNDTIAILNHQIKMMKTEIAEKQAAINLKTEKKVKK